VKQKENNRVNYLIGIYLRSKPCCRFVLFFLFFQLIWIKIGNIDERERERERGRFVLVFAFLVSEEGLGFNTMAVARARRSFGARWCLFGCKPARMERCVALLCCAVQFLLSSAHQGSMGRLSYLDQGFFSTALIPTRALSPF
jgi:hypothetical protein